MKTLTDIITFLRSHLSDGEFEDLIDTWGLDGYFNDPLDTKEIIQELCLSDITLVSSIDGKYYPLPDYGWDGGNAISTYFFNIKLLTPWVDLFGGPMASIICKEDPNLPAFSFNKYDGDDSTSFLIFV